MIYWFLWILPRYFPTLVSLQYFQYHHKGGLGHQRSWISVWKGGARGDAHKTNRVPSGLVWLHELQDWRKEGPEGKDSSSGHRCHPHSDNLCLHNHSHNLYSHHEPVGKNSSTIPHYRILPCQWSVKLRPFFVLGIFLGPFSIFSLQPFPKRDDTKLLSLIQ